jgi:hypothetical protein
LLDVDLHRRLRQIGTRGIFQRAIGFQFLPFEFFVVIALFRVHGRPFFDALEARSRKEDANHWKIAASRLHGR